MAANEKLLTDEDVEKFEGQMIYDAHSLRAKVCRSDLMKKLESLKPETALWEIGEFFNNTPYEQAGKVSEKQENIAYDVEGGWKLLMRFLGKSTALTIPNDDQPLSEWFAWARSVSAEAALQ